MERPNELMRSVDLFTTDLYQLTCSFSYFVANRHLSRATFEVYFRKAPFGGNYAIMAGLQSVKDFLRTLRITEKQKEYLKSVFPHLTDSYLTWLGGDFTSLIEVKCVDEGQVVFPHEPLITFSGPLGYVQLLETPILNLIGYATLVCTNANRMARACSPKKCVEFGCRRAQGPDGALSASQYAYLGGFTGTSNVEASRKLGIPCVGTMSHAFVTSFSGLQDIDNCLSEGVDLKKEVLAERAKLNWKTNQGELTAFIAFGCAFPKNFIALVDTYSTLQSGILNVILVSKVLIRMGHTAGIRLDSGDLAYYAKQCRTIWQQHMGTTPFTIIASDDLHEDRLLQMKQSQIDIFAIGTHIATCKKQPALGLVCKLVELNGQPKMKLSQDSEKATYPFAKTIYRLFRQKAIGDLLTLAGQEPKSPLSCIAFKTKEAVVINFDTHAVLNRSLNLIPQSIQKARSFSKEAQQKIPEQVFKNVEPGSYPLFVSSAFMDAYTKKMTKLKEG